MKKTILSILLVMFFINGCIYQRELRPRLDNKEIWICENPYVELHWGESEQCSKVIVGDISYEVVFSTTSGTQLSVFEKEMEKEEKNFIDYDYCLFRGHTTYEEKNATVRVEKDFKNIFNGELPTLKFKRYNKEEYLKNNVTSTPAPTQQSEREELPYDAELSKKAQEVVYNFMEGFLKAYNNEFNLFLKRTRNLLQNRPHPGP